jgi:thiosulfate/3-mercaptopyruvate sulfurtransferase
VPEPDYPELTVTAEWLSRRLDARDVVVLDCRPGSSYRAGHVPGAVSFAPELVPDVESLHELERLPDLLGGLGLTGRERLVCCGEVSYSGDAARVFWLLELAGAERAVVLEGGAAGWRAAGNELEVDESTRPQAAWAPEPDTEVLATREYVRRSYGADGVEIVDARGLDAWRGAVAREGRGAPTRAGHIPHALPFDFAAFFAVDGSMLEASETWKLFGRLGPRPSNPVYLLDEFIVHGWGEGAGSAVKPGSSEVRVGPLAYFLLRRAGLADVRLYPGGWADWAGDPYLPVVRIIGAEELRERLAGSRRWFRPSDPPANFAFFDVRHPADHARGHIRGSVTLRSDYFADSLDVRLERYWPELDRASAPVVTYCYGEDCIRSRATSTDAARAGFVNIERFYGGLDEWRHIGEKLTAGE